MSTPAKPALAAAKARGKRLGNVNGAAALQRGGKGNIAAIGAIRAAAARHARGALPVIEDIHVAGTSSLAGIAAELNAHGILTARSGQWYATRVRNLLGRQG